MAIIMTDGFDMYNGSGANTGLAARWSLFAEGSIFTSASMVTGRYGGQATRPAYTSFSGTGTAFLSATLPSNYSSVGAGFAYRRATLSSTQTSSTGDSIYCIRASGGVQCRVGVTNAGEIVVGRSDFTTSLLGTSSPGVIVANTWQYIEIGITIHGSAGVVVVKVDGATILNLTGKNTKDQTASTANQVCIGCGSNNSSPPNIDFDDLYVVDSVTTLGERRIETLRPASDSTVAWTPNSGANNYSRVNETLVDGDTSYVSSSTLNQRDLYAIGALSSTPASIDCVNVVSFAYKTDAGTRAIRNTIKSNGVDATGSDHNLNSSYQRYDEIYSQDPDGSTAWTLSKVNGLLIGPKVTI